MLGPEQGDASYNLGPGRHCPIQNRRALPHSSAYGSWNLAYASPNTVGLCDCQKVTFLPPPSLKRVPVSQHHGEWQRRLMHLPWTNTYLLINAMPLLCTRHFPWHPRWYLQHWDLCPFYR